MFAKEIGNADQSVTGCRRDHPSGRSCVIHVLWNGFLFVGDAPHGAWWWVVAADCAGTAFPPATGACCNQAAGSGGPAAENCDRNAEPVIRLTKRLNAATTATAGRHRRECRAPRTSTVG